MSGQNSHSQRRHILAEIRGLLDEIAKELSMWVTDKVVVPDEDGGYFTTDPKYVKRLTYEQHEARLGFSVRCGEVGRDLMYEYRFDFIEDPGIWWWPAEGGPRLLYALLVVIGRHARVAASPPSV